MEPEQLIARVQELTGRLEDLDDPACRSLAEELTSAVVQMYGAGLERIVELADAGTRDEMSKDSLVAGLLMIHDLYPVPIEERVAQALDTVRPYMESHGGNVELLGIEDGIAKLRLEGSCKSCRASSSTLELAVRQALEEAAPGPARDGRGGDRRGGERRSPELPCRWSTEHRHGTRLDIDPPPTPSRQPMSTGVPLVRRERRRHAARVPQHVRELRRRHGWRCARRRRAQRVRAAVAASSCRRPAGRWTTNISSSSPSRCCARRRGSRSPCEADRRGGRRSSARR